MKLKIQEIGKVSEADIDINGIAIIAGENNTGKSTVGKVLFSIFQTYYDLKNKLFDERYNSLKQLLDNGLFFSSLSVDLDFSYHRYQELLDENIKRMIFLYDKTQDREVLEKDEFLLKVYDDNTQNKVDEIIQRLQIDNKLLLQNILTRTFKVEFNNQINYLFDKTTGEIDLSIKDKDLSLKVFNNEVKISESLLDISTEITYIDNPLIIEEDRDIWFSFDSDIIQHHSAYLKRQFKKEKAQNAIEQVIVDNRLASVNKILSEIYDWRLVSDDTHSIDEKKIDFKNLSSGLKSFYIIKKLIENGTIKNRNTIILDEPEVHLHPEWQILYAEILVILHQELDLHILINTHSPYFLNAIEVFSEKYNIVDKCSYYLSKNENGRSKIIDVTGNTSEIYKVLSKPLQNLENIRGSLDD